MPHWIHLFPLGTKHEARISYIFQSRLVPCTEKALQKFIYSFIHFLNKYGVIAGLLLKNILNIVPAIRYYNEGGERETRQIHK